MKNTLETNFHSIRSLELKIKDTFHSLEIDSDSPLASVLVHFEDFHRVAEEYRKDLEEYNPKKTNEDNEKWMKFSEQYEKTVEMVLLAVQKASKVGEKVGAARSNLSKKIEEMAGNEETKNDVMEVDLEVEGTIQDWEESLLKPLDNLQIDALLNAIKTTIYKAVSAEMALLFSLKLFFLILFKLG